MRARRRVLTILGASAATAALGAAPALAQGGSGVNALDVTLTNGVLTFTAVSAQIDLTFSGDPATGEILLDRRNFGATVVEFRGDAVRACRDGFPAIRCAAGGIVAIGVEDSGLGVPQRLEVLPGTPVRVNAFLGGGDDTYLARAGRTDTVSGGPGTDSIALVAPGAVGRADDAFRYNPDSLVPDGFLLPMPATSLSNFEAIETGIGDDDLHGGPDAVRFLAGSGDDTVDGSIRDDVLNAGPGSDTLTGSLGNDRLVAEDGDDVLAGDEGDDTLTGGPGADRLTGGPGADSLDGGPGADTILARDGTADRVVCEAGADSYDLDLKDDFGAAQVCLATPPPAVSQFVSRLDTALRTQVTARVSPTLVPPRTPQVAAGAVGEGANVVLLPGLVRGRAATRSATVRLRCPAAGRACSGSLRVRAGGREVGTSLPHRIPAGATRQVSVALRGAAARVGARTVLVRIVERGRLGPKTSAAVRVLAVGA